MTGPASFENTDLLAALVDEASIEPSSTPHEAPVAPPAAPLPPRYGALHRAAAVLADFEREQLNPAPSEQGDAPDDLDALLSICKLVAVPGADQSEKGRTRWTLQLAARRRTLAEMGTPVAIERALAANPGRTPDHPVQQMFELYVAGLAPALQEQDSRQLTGTKQVVEWLEGLGIVSNMPSAQEVRDRSEQATLLQPFETLAGRHFAGRGAELARLREHVGVMPPGSLGERVRRLGERVFELHEKPPLVVWGPGGVGKSSLVARFIWEHATVPQTERFPWAYMDFDRPGLLAEEPLTLLIEAARQLGIQYPGARDACDQMRQRWINDLAARPPEVRQAMRKSVAPGQAVALTKGASYSRERQRQLLAFRDLLENLKVPQSPFLLVLDTFEQVQYRSPVVVEALLEFLAEFQTQVPRLRTVIAGRAAISAKRPTETLPLGGFDAAAAHALLVAHGLPSDIAQQIFDAVGGSPMSLRLAADAWKAGGDPTADLRKRSFFGWRLQDTQIQAQLFARILNHIHDPDVRRLAHPGLVLRRVTPEIIANVLAGPCEVKLGGPADAQRLFDEMAREVSLVRLEDGALIYRSDVRRIVMGLLRESDPDRVLAIEEAAVTHYAAHDQIPRDAATVLLERAEELYHRLQLQQPPEILNERWMTGVEPHLAAAIDELPPRERAWLASHLGRRLLPEELAQASLDAWERDTARSVRELLDSGEVQGALRSLHERKERLAGSALYLLEAEALDRAGDWDALRVLCDVGIQSADERSRRDLSIGLRLFAARAELHDKQATAARALLDEAQALASSSASLVRPIELTLHRLALLRVEKGTTDGVSVEAAALRATLCNDVQRLSDGEVVRNATLMAWVEVEIAESDRPTFGHLLHLLGLPTTSNSGLRRLALSLASWDSSQSEPGALARRVGAQLAASLTERWTGWVLTTSPSTLGPALAQLFEANTPPEGVTAAIAELLLGRARALLVPGDILAQRARAADEAEASNAPTPPLQPATAPGSRRQTDAALLKLITDSLAQAFSRAELSEMLLHRLNRQLESITAVAEAQPMIAMRLVFVADAEDWLPHLVAAALESRPGHSGLINAARRLGLSGAAYDVETPSETLTEDVSISPQWIARLPQLIGMVCRLETVQPDGGVRTLGSACLVGPDLLLTASACVEPLLQGELVATSIHARFDEQRQAGGDLVVAGTAYPLAASDGLIATLHSDPHLQSKPDCALLRLARPAGVEPVGGANAEPGAPARRWLSLSPDADPLVQREGLVVLFYAPDQPLRAKRGIAPDFSSLGAPWLDDEARLCALTVLADGAAKADAVLAPIGAIRNQIKQRGLDGLLDQALA